MEAHHMAIIPRLFGKRKSEEDDARRSRRSSQNSAARASQASQATERQSTLIDFMEGNVSSNLMDYMSDSDISIPDEHPSHLQSVIDADTHYNDRQLEGLHE